MCFSAEASFIAAAVIGGVGCLNFLTLKLRKSLLFVALIPLLFAFHQFSEGLVWLYLNNTYPDAVALKYVPYMYLVFAFLVWPVYFPLSFWFAESAPLRKRILLGLVFAGLALDIYYLKLIPKGYSLHIYESSIRYSFPSEGFPYAYVAVGALPAFISSLKKAWIFGLFLTVSFFFTHYIFEKTFVSVWCFFGAISTLALYFILKQNQGTPTSLR